MTKNILIMSCVGLACVALAVVGILFVQRGAHLDLPGQILKVRTAPIDDGTTVAVIDFRVSNTSDYPAVVRTVTVYDEAPDGSRTDGRTIDDPSAKRVIDALPILGQKYNASLVIQDQIPGHATWDRMIAATFKATNDQLQKRARFIVAIEEIDGKVFEIKEK